MQISQQMFSSEALMGKRKTTPYFLLADSACQLLAVITVTNQIHAHTKNVWWLKRFQF